MRLVQFKAVAGLLIASCTMTACEQSIDPEKAQQVMASYAVLDLHKAIVLDTQTGAVYGKSGISTPELALEFATNLCKGVPPINVPNRPPGMSDADWEAKRLSVVRLAHSQATRPSADCVPMAIDDTQLYNPVPGAVAAQQRREADAAAADANAAAMLPAVLQTLQGLKH